MLVAILIGGKGTRTRSISKKIPKPFLKINKKSIIERQLDQLREFKKIYLLSNHKIAKFTNSLKKWNVNIIEEKKPLGNAGCLKKLEQFKNFNDDILIISGDLVFNFDIEKYINFHKKNKSDITFLVHPNDHIIDSDAVELDKNNKLIEFHKKPHLKDNIGNLCLAGIMIIKKKILKFIRKNKFQDFSKDIFPILLKKNLKIYGYNTREYIKDAGTPKRIRLVKKHLKSIKYNRGSLKSKIPAIFLDRDGVINKEYPSQHYQNPLEVIDGSIMALKKINNSGYLAVIVTNQSAVAKGFITIENLEKDHKKLEFYFGSRGSYFDRIYYCPYHPQKGFKGEIKKFKKKSTWRKPDNGMFKQAIKDLNIDTNKSYMVGDRYSDYLAAKKTNDFQKKIQSDNSGDRLANLEKELQKSSNDSFIQKTTLEEKVKETEVPNLHNLQNLNPSKWDLSEETIQRELEELKSNKK